MRGHIGAARRARSRAGSLPEQGLAEERREDVREAAEIGIHRREAPPTPA